MADHSNPIRVFLIEDYRLFRDALRAVIEVSRDLQIIGEAESVEQAIFQLKRAATDVVVVDLRLFEHAGLAAVKTLSRDNPRLRVVALSQDVDSEDALEVVRAGNIHGLLPRNTSSAVLLDAIRSVSRGGVFLGPTIADRLFSSIRDGKMEKPAPQPQPVAGLSPREVQLLRLIASGKSSKEIAVLLDLSVQTVRTYRKNVMKKVGVGNAAELTRFAMFHGLIGSKH